MTPATHRSVVTTKRRTLPSRAWAAGCLAAALAALAAPPLLLAGFIGNPLPAWPIDLMSVVEAVQLGLVPSSVWVNVLAVAAWAVWAVLVAILAVEVLAVARDRPSRAGVPGWIRHLAQVLVAAAIALAGPGQHALALARVAPPVAAASAPAVYPEDAPSPRSQPHAKGRIVTVSEGDSWGGFASELLGDASLGGELRAANLGRHVGGGEVVSETTAFVEPGWRLLIPARLESGPPPSAERRGVQNDAKPGTWEVERGDHFWAIAEDALTKAWGRTPTDADITPYWRKVVEANRDALLPPDDPDVIYPGQDFVVPSPPLDSKMRGNGSGATARASSEPDQPNADPRPATTDTADHAAPPPSADGEEDEAVERHEAPAPVTPQAPTGDDGRRTASEATATPEVDETSPPPDAEDDARTALGVPVGLAAGVAASSILAAGVVATLRWRRRTLLQQRAPGMRLPTPLPETDAEVAKLDAAAAPEETLEDLASLLASIPFGVHPVIVRVTDNGHVTLLFDERRGLPDPPPPWTLADDGAEGPVGWQARLGDGGLERSFGIPLLVTLGRSGTSTVLGNIGAMGTLVLEGVTSEIRRRLRAVTLDIATSRISIPVEVAVTGDDRFPSLDRIRHVHDPGDEIKLALAEVGEVVLDDRTPRLLVCHHGVDAPDVPEELIGMVGVVSAAAVTTAAWVMDLEDQHTGRLRLPDGGTVGLALPDIDPDVIDDELTRLDEPATIDAVEPQDTPSSRDAFDPGSNGHSTKPQTAKTEPAWCEVRLLGPIDVVRNGSRVDGLTPGTLEILAYLATHPDGVTKERLDNIIWAGAAARPGSQRVTSALTKLRKVLGEGPDGEPLVPRRSGDEPIVLSDHLGTDIDRAFAHLAVARDLPADLRTRELAAALELIRGEPLEGRPYSWATDIGEQAIVQLQDAALEVARACRDAGDLDAAEMAIEQGLKLLDPNGWLYLERAHVARLRGRPEQPLRIFEHYRRKLADDADEIAGTVASPPPEIELAFRKLMAPT